MWRRDRAGGVELLGEIVRLRGPAGPRSVSFCGRSVPDYTCTLHTVHLPMLAGQPAR